MTSLLKRLRMGRRALTADRGLREMHTTEQIGPKRHKTPEGFLFCEDVPIARVGMLMYGAGEIPAQPGPDGLIWCSRTEDELFSAETIASFNGKDVVDEHPAGGVTTGNYNSVTVGITLNPRRGEGADSDVLLADLLIKEAQAIRDVQAGKREVSAGYEADYRQQGPGVATQSAIIGNHVALVEKGRCGPRCAIGDHSHTHQQEQSTMPMTMIPRRPISAPRTAIGAAVRAIFKDAEAAAMEALTTGTGGSDGNDAMLADDDTGSGGDIHIHVGGNSAAPITPAAVTTDEDPDPDAGDDPLATRVAALETGVAEILTILKGQQAAPAAAKTGDEAPPANDDDPKRAGTGDSAALETGFKEMQAAAEILVPGITLPTFDAKVTRAATMDSMCAFRRRVLDAAALTTDGAALLAGLSDGLDLAKATCTEVSMLFKGAAAAKGQGNNRMAVGDGRLAVPNQEQPTKSKAPMSIAELNTFNRKHYANQ